MYSYSAHIKLGKRGGDDFGIGYGNEVDSLRLTASRHSVPTVQADVTLNVPNATNSFWVFSPTEPKLSYARLELKRTGGGEPDQTRTLLLWVSGVEETVSVTGYSYHLTLVSADWILQQHRLREDTTLLPTTGTVLHYQTLAEWWGANIHSSPIVDRPHDNYRSFVQFVSDLSHETPGAPYDMPDIALDPGVTLWDVASQLAQHWQGWVNGAISDDLEPTVGISSFVGPSGQGKDLRQSTGKIIEQRTATNLEGWGESVQHIQRYWVENADGDLEEKQTSTVYWSGVSTDLSLIHEVETWGSARLTDAMQHRAERTGRRARLTSITTPIDLDLWLNDGVVVTGDRIGNTGRREDWQRWITAISYDLASGTQEIDLAEGDGSLFLSSWEDIDTLTWQELPQETWNEFE